MRGEYKSPNYMKEWRENNKEKIKSQQKAYNKKNKEKIAEKSKEWREKNKMSLAEYKKRYGEDMRKNDPNRIKGYHLKTDYNITFEQYEKLLKKQKGNALYAKRRRLKFIIKQKS